MPAASALAAMALNSSLVQRSFSWFRAGASRSFCALVVSIDGRRPPCRLLAVNEAGAVHRSGSQGHEGPRLVPRLKDLGQVQAERPAGVAEAKPPSVGTRGTKAPVGSRGQSPGRWSQGQSPRTGPRAVKPWSGGMQREDEVTSLAKPASPSGERGRLHRPWLASVPKWQFSRFPMVPGNGGPVVNSRNLKRLPSTTAMAGLIF